MVRASKHLMSNPADMAKCGSAASKTGNLGAECAGGNKDSCIKLGRQMLGLRRL
jgi:hypothetical protein